jgi:nitrite reductase/ring-hydroxylating ferredoxin subunit
MNPYFVVSLGTAQYQLPRECPHRGGLLSCGTLNQGRGTITCPLHFSVFDVRSGRHLSGPACPDLPVVALTNPLSAPLSAQLSAPLTGAVEINEK